MASTSREEKQLQMTVDMVIQHVSDLKNKLESLLLRMEHEQHDSLNWPSFLDNFALISSQISTLTRNIKTDKAVQLKSYALLPSKLNPDMDENLKKITDGRVQIFNHEVVPDYLRTKPEPAVEERSSALISKAVGMTTENVSKHTSSLNNAVMKITELVENERDRVEADIGQRSQPPPSYRQKDTEDLVSAITFGRGLVNRPPPMISQQHMIQPTSNIMQTAPNIYQQKMPSIKTNIRGANNHPYAR